MVADRPYDDFYGFYSVSPEYFGYPSYSASRAERCVWPDTTIRSAATEQRVFCTTLLGHRQIISPPTRGLICSRGLLYLKWNTPRQQLFPASHSKHVTGKIRNSTHTLDRKIQYHTAGSFDIWQLFKAEKRKGVKWATVKWSELRWSEVNYGEWSELRWSELQWTEVRYG
jgi:hypothetical protein